MLVGILTTLSIIFLIFAFQRKNTVLDQPITINKSFASDTLKPMLMVVFPKDVWEKTQSKLIWADVNYTPTDFLSLKILAGIIIPLIVSALGVAAGVDFFVFLVLAVAGYILPDIWLDRKVEARQKSIQKDLYEFELMLSTVISAGLEVVEAFRLVGERFGGEINKEVVRTTMEINTGVHKSKAFEKMAVRVGLDDFTKLVYLINQSDRLGTPLSETLTNLVAQMKLDRLLKLQKQAEEAKVKILFPTTVWILVPLLVMMFYPLFTQLKGAF